MTLLLVLHHLTHTHIFRLSIIIINTMSKRSRRESDLTDHQLLHVDSPVVHDIQPPGKYTQFDCSTVHDGPKHVISCALPPHEPLNFNTYEDYEVHYHKSHVNRCLDCGRNLPTGHFLSLHIAENHDPLSATRRDRGEKTYHCFVEDCDKICRTPQKRRMHLVDKHMFPKNYDFYIVNHGVDNRTSMLKQPGGANRQKKSNIRTAQNDTGKSHNIDRLPSATDHTDMDELPVRNDNSPAKDVSMDEITDSVAALKFVPKSVTFGRGRHHGGFAKK